MNLAPILEAPPMVQLHLATIVPAFCLGTWLILVSIKGSRPHRALGYIYKALMFVSATAAIFVTEIRPGQFSFLHLLILLTYFNLAQSWLAVRRHDVAKHKKAMVGLYIGGLLVAGAFTLFPGRVLYRVFFR
jgi:uncharacterized membrane protein